MVNRHPLTNHLGGPLEGPLKGNKMFQTIIFGSYLVGGWTNPSEKYARQIGNLPQIGVKIKSIWNHHVEEKGAFKKNWAGFKFTSTSWLKWLVGFVGFLLLGGIHLCFGCPKDDLI